MEMFTSSVKNKDGLFREIERRSSTISASLDSLTPIEGDPKSFRANYLVYLLDEGKRDNFIYTLRSRPEETFSKELLVRREATELGKKTYRHITGGPQREIGIYPTLVSANYKPYEKACLILEENICELSFHEKMFKDPKSKEIDTLKKYAPGDFYAPLDPLILHHWVLYAQLRSKNKISKLPRISIKDHTKNLLEALEHLKMIKATESTSGLEDPIRELSHKYLGSRSLEGLVHNSTHPGNNTNNYLLNASRVGIGSIALDLGHFLGQPTCV